MIGRSRSRSSSSYVVPSYEMAAIILYLALFSILTLHSSATTSPTNSLTTTLSGVPTTNKCRTVFNNAPLLCPQEDYNALTSFSCYYYLPTYIISTTSKFFPCRTPTCSRLYVCRRENVTIVNGKLKGDIVLVAPKDWNISDDNSLIYSTFLRDTDKVLWQDCYKAALKCCDKMLSTPASDNPTICPRTWDSWQCFDDTPAGNFTDSFCPDYIYFRSEPPACPGGVRKYCSAQGTHWAAFDKNSSGEWTNYSSCLDVDVVKNRHVAHIAAHAISIVALLPAIIIFFVYKQLHVHRITMHKNLFISLMVNGVVFIVFKKLAILNELEKGATETSSIVRDSTAGCKFLFILTKYTRATNYLWMLCEGFYLHKLIVAAFAEQRNLRLYYLIGWGFPIIPVTAYSIIRATNSEYNERCWTYPIEQYEWIVNGPNLASLILNLIFLCNIIRVLLTKLGATNSNEPNQYRKAVRATLLLVPLFGLHFIFTIVKPQSGPCKWLEVYHYFNYLLDGLQGLVVALTFCYFNREVIELVKRSYSRWKVRQDPSTNSRGMSRYSLSGLSNTQIVSLNDSPTLHHGDANGKIMELNPRKLEDPNKDDTVRMRTRDI